MSIKNKNMFVSVQMTYTTKDTNDAKKKERIIEAIMSEAGEFICNLANDENIETNHYKWGTQSK
jgi:hypothetical protein|tara:strand:+ start:845 stop:1036 length:192 start_codon:yes stop_codon:yes gene_type:complete